MVLDYLRTARDLMKSVVKIIPIGCPGANIPENYGFSFFGLPTKYIDSIK